MLTVLRTALMAGILVTAPLVAFAQSPIPESRVPGFGGQDTRPGSIGSSPGSSGSSVGSNVGAGASASPVGIDPQPAPVPETAEAPVKPLIGLSRELPIR